MTDFVKHSPCTTEDELFWLWVTAHFSKGIKHKWKYWLKTASPDNLNRKVPLVDAEPITLKDMAPDVQSTAASYAYFSALVTRVGEQMGTSVGLQVLFDFLIEDPDVWVRFGLREYDRTGFLYTAYEPMPEHWIKHLVKERGLRLPAHERVCAWTTTLTEKPAKWLLAVLKRLRGTHPCLIALLNLHGVG